jgi:hypothetical protein
MAHHSERIDAREKFLVPRGFILGGLAISSWALLIALWSALSASFSFILGS